ncbi:heavy metal translocating P-type ATPase [Salinicoccus hispanicus]|uniref:Cd(2+)-exporting ATPase n=1 Tax=Salinicoccus hispanicus TaxID=157225 RepID=A0A6N8U1V4_9STAP|nr:heavy metal translocating P-type ATPase [Salinicoccus hispanicus]MXQ50111.1 cadmium-translocating P-type ATPase [Salinicoccus hispanicus]
MTDQTNEASSCCGDDGPGDPDDDPEGCCSQSEEKVANGSACCSTETKEAITQKSEASACCGGQDSVDDPESCCSNSAESNNEPLTSQVEKKVYRIQGMDCPSCAMTIEKGVNALSNILEAKVSYSTAKLQVIGMDQGAFDNAERTVKNLGFDIEMPKQSSNMKTYIVEGMDCGSCAKSVENHLNKLSQVRHADVSFSTGKMKVDHDNSVEDIISEVSKIGYHASLAGGSDSNSDSKPRSEYQNIIITGALIAVGFIGSYAGLPQILSTMLYAIAIVISGYKPVKSAYYALRSRSLDMNVLMSAAAIGAALIGEWFEGATVVWLFALGTALQNQSMERTRKSIKNLMDLAPSDAWVRSGTELVQKPVSEISVGEITIIKPGDRVPLDGEVMKGETSINQAPITGESMPVDKVEGDTVYAGTINEHGSIEVRVTKLVKDTTISKIIHMVEEAQEQRAPTQAFIDRFASIYTPIVFAAALAVIVLPPLFGMGSWGEWIYKGLALLVVACPCALVISTPVAIVSAIGNAAKNGVLIKGGTFLEKAAHIKVVAFDKTGTLTEGKPQVNEVLAYTTTEEELLAIAYTLEDYSTHPIGRTIVDHAKNQGIRAKEGELFSNIVGKGVQATIDDQVYYAGNRKLFDEAGISLISYEKELEDIQYQGKTVVIVGTEKEVIGVIAVSDTIRKTTAQALSDLKQTGVDQVVMLTGDNEGTAKRIAAEANVNRYFAELLPEDKVNAVRQLQAEGHKVAMVGDGINDAPALALSDIGIAMGGAGTDTAMETADIVLMADNLEKLPHTMKLSRKALRIIKQNIWFSLIIKAIALVFIFPGWLTLWMAVLSDTGAAIIVILNALRLLNVKE